MRTVRTSYVLLLGTVLISAAAAAGFVGSGSVDRADERPGARARPGSELREAVRGRARDPDRHERVPARHDHDHLPRGAAPRPRAPGEARRGGDRRARVRRRGARRRRRPWRCRGSPRAESRCSWTARRSRPSAGCCSRSLLTAVFGAAVGAIVQSQVGAIVGWFIWILVVESLVTVLSGLRSRRSASRIRSPSSCPVPRSAASSVARAASSCSTAVAPRCSRSATRSGCPRSAPSRSPAATPNDYPAAMAAPVKHARGGRAPGRLARLRRQRRRAAERLRRLRPARASGRPRARAGDEGEARLRRGADDRGARPVAAARRSAVRALPRLRRLPLPGSRLRGAGRGEARPGARCAEADRRASPSRRSSRSSPPTSPFFYRNKLEYSFTQTPSGRRSASTRRAAGTRCSRSRSAG